MTATEGASNVWGFLATLAVVSVPVLAATIAGWWKFRQTDRKADSANTHAAQAKATGEEVQAAIGVPNGNGSVVQMVTKILGYQLELFAGQRELTERLGSIAERDAGHEARRAAFLAELGAKYAELVARLDTIEAQLKGVP